MLTGKFIPCGLLGNIRNVVLVHSYIYILRMSNNLYSYNVPAKVIRFNSIFTITISLCYKRLNWYHYQWKITLMHKQTNKTNNCPVKDNIITQISLYFCNYHDYFLFISIFKYQSEPFYGCIALNLHIMNVHNYFIVPFRKKWFSYYKKIKTLSEELLT